MPMSFPDMGSLERAAGVWKFRGPDAGETEAAYREALADFVVERDPIESMEIRTGSGWDAWDSSQEVDSVRRAIWAAPPGCLKIDDERVGCR